MKKLISAFLALALISCFMLIPANAEDKTVRDIWIVTMPDKTEYVCGEELDLTGLVLAVAYTDGTSETVDSGYTCNTTVLEKKGTTTVSIEYMGERENMQVYVDYSLSQKIISLVKYLISFFQISFRNIMDWF